MGVIKMILRVFFWPFRLMGRLFFGRTVRKATGSVVARQGASHDEAHGPPTEVPRPTASFPFKTIERPRLADISATEMSLETAERYLPHARRFYDCEFNLFPSDSLFYEEIEADELEFSLGANDPSSTDRNFVHWIDLFRQTLNDNTRRLFVIYTPLLFLVFFVLSIVSMGAIKGEAQLPGTDQITLQLRFLMPPLFLTVALGGLVIIYQWPFKAILQRNTLGLDNYITSRFSRINQNFQVAKRYALNVERNKRMTQVDELRHEAGVWTVAYNWLAMRLFLCERLVRNKMYQINRNATLYRVSGILICFLIIGIVAAVPLSGLPEIPGLDRTGLLVAAGSSVIFIFLSYSLVMGNAAMAAYRALSGNEWFRFGSTNLDQTIADHVAEDKLQIVTFRDRNRME